MLCPRCNTINKDTARQCRECGCRLAGMRVTPEAKKTESKYLISGIVAFIGILLVVVLLITSVSCIACGGSCSSCGRDTTINENVDGDWDAVGTGDVSGSDVSATDAPVAEEAPADTPPAE